MNTITELMNKRVVGQIVRVTSRFHKPGEWFEPIFQDKVHGHWHGMNEKGGAVGLADMSDYSFYVEPKKPQRKYLWENLDDGDWVLCRRWMGEELAASYFPNQKIRKSPICPEGIEE